jgi:hypothetical protein
MNCLRVLCPLTLLSNLIGILLPNIIYSLILSLVHLTHSWGLLTIRQVLCQDTVLKKINMVLYLQGVFNVVEKRDRGGISVTRGM